MSKVKVELYSDEIDKLITILDAVIKTKLNPEEVKIEIPAKDLKEIIVKLVEAYPENNYIEEHLSHYYKKKYLNKNEDMEEFKTMDFHREWNDTTVTELALESVRKEFYRLRGEESKQKLQPFELVMNCLDDCIDIKDEGGSTEEYYASLLKAMAYLLDELVKTEWKLIGEDENYGSEI